MGKIHFSGQDELGSEVLWLLTQIKCNVDSVESHQDIIKTHYAKDFAKLVHLCWVKERDELLQLIEKEVPDLIDFIENVTQPRHFRLLAKSIMEQYGAFIAGFDVDMVRLEEFCFIIARLHSHRIKKIPVLTMVVAEMLERR